jgi:hypothetical protein
MDAREYVGFFCHVTYNAISLADRSRVASRVASLGIVRLYRVVTRAQFFTMRDAGLCTQECPFVTCK